MRECTITPFPLPPVGPAGGAWAAEAASLALMAKHEVCSHSCSDSAYFLSPVFAASSSSQLPVAALVMMSCRHAHMQMVLCASCGTVSFVPGAGTEMHIDLQLICARKA